MSDGTEGVFADVGLSLEDILLEQIAFTDDGNQAGILDIDETPMEMSDCAVAFSLEDGMSLDLAV